MKRYISGLVKLGVGAAIGLGIGYFAFKADQNDCRGVYQKEMTQIEERYKDVPVVDGVATPKDFSLDYIVSEKGGFKGFVFTDTASGKQGVVAKSSVLGNNKFFFEYTSLQGIVDQTDAKVEVQPEIKEYANKE